MGDLMGMNVMNDRRIAAYYYRRGVRRRSCSTCMMIVSGGGLLALSEWGRRLGILVAQLKILRWVLMTIITMVLVLPVSMEVTREGHGCSEAR